MKEMKYILTLIILVLMNKLAAQKSNNVYVEYNFVNNLFYTEVKSILTYNDTLSTFKTFSGEENDKPELKGNNLFIGGANIDNYQVNHKSSNQLISFVKLDDDIAKIHENIPVFIWNLDFGEEKKIGKYVCNKATVKFRGRDYTAWYTKDMPTFFGPWKFNGLPGLIIEISDDTKTYLWKCVKIKIPAKEELIVPYKKYISLSMKEYDDKDNESMEKLRARVRGALPRGTEFKVPKDSRRDCLEIIYEWETDEK